MRTYTSEAAETAKPAKTAKPTKTPKPPPKSPRSAKPTKTAKPAKAPKLAEPPKPAPKAAHTPKPTKTPKPTRAPRRTPTRTPAPSATPVLAGSRDGQRADSGPHADAIANRAGVTDANPDVRSRANAVANYDYNGHAGTDSYAEPGASAYIRFCADTNFIVGVNSETNAVRAWGFWSALDRAPGANVPCRTDAIANRAAVTAANIRSRSNSDSAGHIVTDAYAGPDPKTCSHPRTDRGSQAHAKAEAQTRANPYAGAGSDTDARRAECGGGRRADSGLYADAIANRATAADDNSDIRSCANTATNSDSN